MTTNMWISAGVIALTIAFWATARLPEYLVALLFLAIAACLHLAPPEVLFSGFSSSAFWLVLSGFVLGGAIRKVGLADRMADALAGRLAGSWPRMVSGVVLLSYGLAFVMPSNMGRIALLMPVVMSLAEHAGLPRAGKGRVGLALAVGFATFQLSASILPANVPNLVMAGAAETSFHVSFSYLPYLLLHAPVLGCLKGIALILCICVLFPAAPQPAMKARNIGPMSPRERRLTVLLSVTLLLWMTDVLHGISPAWIGLAAACFCLLPRVGFLDADDFTKEVNIRTCIYVAGILGLAALVVYSGLGTSLGKVLMTALPLDRQNPAASFAKLIALVSALNFTVTANGVPALYTPLAQQLSDASGFPLMTVLMVQVIGYSTPLLPYQASPIIVAMGMEKVPARDGVRLALFLAFITSFLLCPLDYWWFDYLGLIPSA